MPRGAGPPARRDRAVLLRRCRAVRGGARLRAMLDVRAAPDARRPPPRPGLDGPQRRHRIRWRGADEAVVREGPDGGAVLAVTFDLAEGESRDLVLELAAGTAEEPAAALDAGALWEATERDWEQSVPSCDDTIAPRDARLSYAVLTGLTSRNGGMAAAATTALPERADEGRNFDYRYAWIRDQCFAGRRRRPRRAPHVLRSAADFVTARILADGDRLRPAYTVAGDPVPEQRRATCPATPARRSSPATRRAGSGSWTRSARRCCCSPPPPSTTAPTAARSRPPASPPR